ncbi:transglycosylase domain-containing protein [Angustibacter peucedani]
MSLRTDDRGSGLAGILTLLAALVGTSVVAGLIGAGLFMPAVGAAGATARTGVDLFDALPAELEQSPLAQQSRILDADGHILATFYNENRVVVPLKKIAPVMREAQVAIEDTRFRQHGGIDPKGLLRAVVNNASGADTQGASTLTQQYVKLTLQENAIYAGDDEAAAAAVDKNVGRKIQEMKYAVALEKKLTKDQILEGYLNIAYFGDGAYGVETAARHFFSTSAAKLTLPQAALLAGLVQQPGRFDPRKNPKAALTRRNVVLARMLATGAITQKQHDSAAKTKIGLKLRPAGNGCDSSAYPFFCNYVYRQILTNKAFGATEQSRRSLVFRGGLTIRTTLEPKVQAAAQKAVHDKVAPRNKSNVAAAISVVEPGTGKVLAMAQSRPFGRNKKKGQTTVNYNTDSDYGSSRGFQPGSTFKAFTLAAALADGKSLSTVINAPPGGTPFPASDFPNEGCWPLDLSTTPYSPFNSEGREVGNYTLRKITEDSVNTAFVRLESDVGVCKVKAMAENLGMHGAVTSTDGGIDKATNEIRPRPSMTLGAQEVAPLTVAAAYATFAADGVFCSPISITSATTLAGKSISVPKPSCDQAIDDNVARGVTAALEDVIKSGTAARAPKIGRPAAGKTGTANASRATWFTGYTPQMAASVWFGNPDVSKPMKNIDTGEGYYGSQIYGATVAAPIWSAFMSKALSGMPVEQFGKPNDKIVFGERVTVPGVQGQKIEDATRTLEGAGFSVTVGSPKASAVPAGYVAEQNPPGGSRVTAGTTITLYPSTGVAPPPTPTGGPTVGPTGPGNNPPTKKPRKPRKR